MSIPVHIVTGFLGAGKTTLLNRQLSSGDLANTAIIVNEFGDVGIDHLLVESASPADAMIELSDGCLCCTVRGDLVDTLEQLSRRVSGGTPLERVIIETTGLADPAPVLQVIMAAPGIRDRFRVAGVVTAVCALTGLDSLDQHNEARTQVALADVIILTKTDIAPPSPALIATLAALNPLVEPVDANASDVSLTLDDATVSNAKITDSGAGHHNDRHHDNGIEAFTLTHNRPIDEASVGMFVDLLRSTMAPEMLRMKGIVWTEQLADQPLVIHGVRSVFDPPQRLASWPSSERKTRLVVISKHGKRRHIADLFAAFTGQARIDTPDQQAITENPLAIPGM
ncbi:CobW family GTP-binding protein [Oricola cellulosilytica]|uniref:GTP-binding protein n=1 Tax=Oricola cellulosilytica TaxID=1429082 RepID=A0A4R0P983_9HYPH|nr:GTP-binding protein [Oricola cellulosilytica]TCD13740.1 GTP-binding protein [Oricola cellulosilytica]